MFYWLFLKLVDKSIDVASKYIDLLIKIEEYKQLKKKDK